MRFPSSVRKSTVVVILQVLFRLLRSQRCTALVIKRHNLKHISWYSDFNDISALCSVIFPEHWVKDLCYRCFGRAWACHGQSLTPFSLTVAFCSSIILLKNETCLITCVVYIYLCIKLSVQKTKCTHLGNM